MKKKRILVCGATGFIGRNIAEFFAKNSNFEVYGTYYNSMPLDSAGIKMLRANLLDAEDVNRITKDMDIIIQTAAATSGAKDIVTKPYIHVTDNAVMNSLIFRAAYQNKISHVVFFSCTIMYQSSDTPLKETDFDPNREMHPNYFGAGWTKVYLEKMCEFYSRIGTANYTAIRHSNIYGPYDKFDPVRSHVFGATIRKVMKALERSRITIWGSGEEERDLLYVSDLVDFVDKVMEKQKAKFEIFNVGYGQSISVRKLVEKIVHHSGKNLNVEYDLSKHTIKTKICLDTDKAKRITGWVPTTSLDEGIDNTLRWYEKKYLKTNIGRI